MAHRNAPGGGKGRGQVPGSPFGRGQLQGGGPSGRPGQPGQKNFVSAASEVNVGDPQWEECECENIAKRLRAKIIAAAATATEPHSDDPFDSLEQSLFDMKESKKEKIGKPSPIYTEFLYYSAMLKELAPKMSEDTERQKIIPWIKKMSRPEYQTQLLQEKRNR